MTIQRLSAVFLACMALWWAYGQNVGIGTATPHASAKLEIDDANRGLLIPRVALNSTTNGIAPVSGPATGLLVFNTATAGTPPNNVWPGFYYWDGARWTRLEESGKSWLLAGNIGTNPSTHFIGTVDPQDLVFRTQNTEQMRITANGRVGIGTANPLEKLHIEGNMILNGGRIAASPQYSFSNVSTTVFIPDGDIPREGLIIISINGDAAPGSAILQIYRGGTYNGAWLIAHDGNWSAGTTSEPGGSGYRVWVENNSAGARLVIKHTYSWCCRTIRIYSLGN